uniref:Replication factor C subunit 1 n=1 Tax=Setaria digitata TaxID=48799 RepID=A0A915PR01_9BILA
MEGMLSGLAFPDIRRYFGSSQGKSALTELRASQGSPSRTDARSQAQVAPKKVNKRQLVADVLLSDASDDENPLPRSLRKELRKKRAKKRILLSSDDDDELPPSASQIRPLKRGEKISLKAMDDKPMGSSLKPVQSTTDEEVDVTEDESGFVQGTTLKKKRSRTPPFQKKLDFSSLNVRQKDSPKKKSLVPELEVINPTEFFGSFNKVTEKKKTEQHGSEVKRKSPSKKSAEVITSPQTSIRKSNKELVAKKENKCEKKMLSRSDKNDNPSQLSNTTQTQVSKTKISPRMAKSTSVNSETTKKDITVLEEGEEQLQAAGKRRKEYGTRKKVSIWKENISRVKANDNVREKKAAESRVTGQKSSKMARISVEDLKDHGLNEIEVVTEEEMFLPWVDKYKPSSTKHLVGQNGEKSPFNKLLGWLRNWAKNHLGEGAKQKKARPPPWLAQSDGTAFKAVMLSGPPGVGKTTCAVMACKELGMRYVEKNASDVRNKKALEAQTSELIGCEQMDDYMNCLAAHKVNTSGKVTHVLIMDEVDGMSGNDDRAGARLLTIVCQEHLKVGKEEIDEIIETAQHDVRQSIYNLQLLGSGGKGMEIESKDAAVNPFEAARRLLNINTPTWEKQQMFFVDPSIMPLFVQENYPFVQNSNMSASERLCALRKAANSISEGDIIDRIIRTTGAWTLLNEQALFSSLVPTSYMNGYMKGMINFPSWLGKNSTLNKRQRLLRQLTTHTYLRTFAAILPMVLDYIPVLRNQYCRPLLDKENDGVNDVVNMYKEYNLVRDDIESIAELAIWPGIKDPGAAIPAKAFFVKAALTRTLNKEHIILPYALDTLVKGRKKERGVNLNPEVDEEGNLVEGADDENDLDDSGKESDDDKFAGLTTKKPNLSSENGKTHSGKGRGTGSSSRGVRGSRVATGRGRSKK